MARNLFNFSIRILFIVAAIHPAGIYGQGIKEYNLKSPYVTYTLPGILNEISGLTFIDASVVACIQDEAGVVFFYDLITKNITKELPFAPKGDFEGIAKAGRSIFILRSDGTLFEIDDFKSNNYKIAVYKTSVPAKDNEGLFYDKVNNMLLIGCKGRIGEGDKYKNRREIYGFDLKSKTLVKEPVFVFDLKAIKKIAGNDKIGLLTSDIAIHPLTKKLYLLSAADNLLLVFNLNGNVEQVEKLHSKLFPQAEGIAFFENGDMLISNEGGKNNGTILKYKYDVQK